MSLWRSFISLSAAFIGLFCSSGSLSCLLHWVVCFLCRFFCLFPFFCWRRVNVEHNFLLSYETSKFPLAGTNTRISRKQKKSPFLFFLLNIHILSFFGSTVWCHTGIPHELCKENVHAHVCVVLLLNCLFLFWFQVGGITFFFFYNTTVSFSPPSLQSASYQSHFCVIQTWTVKYAQTNTDINTNIKPKSLFVIKETLNHQFFPTALHHGCKTMRHIQTRCPHCVHVNQKEIFLFVSFEMMRHVLLCLGVAFPCECMWEWGGPSSQYEMMLVDV